MLRRLTSAIGRLFSRLGPNDFVINYQPNQPLDVRGAVAKGKIPGLIGFFKHDLALKRPAKVTGSRGRSGIRVNIKGSMSKVQRQRARNFLLEHLR